MPGQMGRIAADEAAPWIERLARVGFAAKGVLYLTIGVLSVRAAMGAGGRAVTDTHGALDVLHGTFGRAAVAIVALGLAGYGVWLLVSAFTDAEGRGREAKEIAMRIGAAARGVVHLALAGTAISVAMWQRSGGGGNDSNAKHWTSRALEMPAGEYIVWGVAGGFAAFGIWQLYCAWKAKLDKHLDLQRLGQGARSVVVALSRFGIAARGVVFITIGVLFARAASRQDASEAGGTGASMRELFAFGRWAFIGIAAGVAAYGVYQLIQARYRRIRVR